MLDHISCKFQANLPQNATFHAQIATECFISGKLATECHISCSNCHISGKFQANLPQNATFHAQLATECLTTFHANFRQKSPKMRSLSPKRSSLSSLSPKNEEFCKNKHLILIKKQHRLGIHFEGFYNSRPPTGAVNLQKWEVYLQNGAVWAVYLQNVELILQLGGVYLQNGGTSKKWGVYPPTGAVSSKNEGKLIPMEASLTTSSFSNSFLTYFMAH
jgi:hypothetical protein